MNKIKKTQTSLSSAHFATFIFTNFATFFFFTNFATFYSLLFLTMFIPEHTYFFLHSFNTSFSLIKIILILIKIIFILIIILTIVLNDTMTPII